MNTNKFKFKNEEVIQSLHDLQCRIFKILHVYETSLEDDRYNYQEYIENIILFVKSLNEFINYDLTSVIVDLNSLLSEDIQKPAVKKRVFDLKNYLQFLIDRQAK